MLLAYAVLGVGLAASSWSALHTLRQQQFLSRLYFLTQVPVILGLGVLAVMLEPVQDHREPVWIMTANSIVYLTLLCLLNRSRRMDMVRVKLCIDLLSLMAVGYYLVYHPHYFDLEDCLMWYVRAPLEIPTYAIILLSRSTASVD